MLTAFGKVLRKLRIDNEEHLKDMANKLGVTVSYLSAVENGKRKIPDTWLEIIHEKYTLCNDQLVELRSKALEEQKNITFNLNNFGIPEKEVVLSFARNFENMDQDDLDTIRNLLKKYEEDK